jgi:transposase
MERATREQWSKRVERWRASGLTASEFSRKIGVREGTLRWWSWMLSSKREPAAAAPSAGLSSVTFMEMTAAVRREPIEVVLPSGHRLRVPQDFEASAIERLLHVLERRR